MLLLVIFGFFKSRDITTFVQLSLIIIIFITATIISVDFHAIAVMLCVIISVVIALIVTLIMIKILV